MVRKILALLASLTLLVMSFISIGSPSFARTPGAYAAPPTQGEVLGIRDWIRDQLGKVDAFVDRTWEAVSCYTNIDCLMRNAVTSAMNHILMFLIGVPYTELTGGKITAMLNGEWNTGLAFTGAMVIDGAYIDPPGLSDLHLASYLKYELSDNLLSGRVYAATAGETLLAPVRSAWEGVRDATYGFFMLIMVAIGFMIMLRRQIAPRVVVSFTAALPKILMGLVLITLSFSLVALAFDVVGNFGSRVLITALERTEGYPPDPLIGTPQYSGVVGSLLGVGASQLIGESIVTIFASYGDLDTAPAIQSLQALMVFCAFFILLVFAFFSVAFQLIFRIAKLLIKAILSPVMFLIGSLPGQEGSITGFAKGLITDCAAFPAIAFMFGVTRLFLREAMTLYEPSEVVKVGTIGNVYKGVGLICLTIVFLVMTFAAPFLVEKVINPKK